MEHKIVFPKKNCLVTLLCVFFTVGCVAPDTRLPTSTLEPIDLTLDAKIHTATITLENTDAIRPEQISSPTPLNQSNTQTITVTSTPTQLTHPYPTALVESTMTAAETKTLVFNMFNDNGDCSLPCFWGLSPQLTNAHYSQSFIQRFGNTISEKDIYTHSNAIDSLEGYAEINLYNDRLRTHVSITYYNQKEKLEQIIVSAGSYMEEGNGENVNSKITFGESIFTHQLDYYMLPNVLNNYDKPSDVLILPILYGAPYLVQDLLSLVLIYQEDGFMVEYIFPLNYDGELLVGCPNQVGYINIVTWPTDEDLSMSSILSKKSSLGINSENINSYKSIEDATSLTVNDFYKTFNIKNAKCLQTPHSLWGN